MCLEGEVEMSQYSRMYGCLELWLFGSPVDLTLKEREEDLL